MSTLTLPSSRSHSPADATLTEPRRPALLITVDTEEEFDWHRPAAGQLPRITHTTELERLQDLCDELGVRPTYVVDYPLLTDTRTVEVLQGLARRGTCELGAHLHPWVNPPVTESSDPRNTYLGNLPLSLQEDKIATLTESFAAALNFRPTSFKAGRYGLTPATANLLGRYGYIVDGSAVAYTSFTDDGGPDFRHLGNAPFVWPQNATSDPSPGVLEVPCSVAYTRPLLGQAHALHQRLSSAPWRYLRLIGVLWHTRLLRKIFVSPEVHSGAEVKVALAAMCAGGEQILHLSFHSPSLAPGHTPYVRDRAQRDAFIATLRDVLGFACRDLGAVSYTLSEFAALYSGTSP